MRNSGKDSDSKVPDQKELEKELNEYLGKKYGERVRLVVPLFFPKAQPEEVSKEEKEPKAGKKQIDFDLKPEELEAFLNDYIIRQEGSQGDSGHQDLYPFQSDQVHGDDPGKESI